MREGPRRAPREYPDAQRGASEDTKARASAEANESQANVKRSGRDYKAVGTRSSSRGGFSGALVEARQYEFAVPERLGGGEPAVRRAEHHVDQLVAGLLQREITMDQAGDKLIEMMFRTANGRLTAAEALGHREFVLTRLYESA